MGNFVEILVIFAILSNSVHGQFIPFPYNFQNEEYADRSFGNFFNRYPMQARNDTPITQATTTVKPPSTTETIIYIPVIQETIYQPDYYPIPPYPVFYNAPVPADINQFDNFMPYQLPNDLPSFMPNGVPLFPFLEQAPKVQPEKIILQPLPSNIKPALPSSAQNGNTDVEMTDADRELFAAELTKLINNFLTKKLEKLDSESETYTEKNIDALDTNSVYEYKVIKPWSTSSPGVSAHPPNSLNEPIKQIRKDQNATVPLYNFGDRIKQVSKDQNATVPSYNFGDRIKQDKKINKTLGNQLVSNLPINYNRIENASTQSSQANQFKWTTPETDIDESRKFDFNGEGETSGKEYEESTTDTSANELLPIFSKDLIKGLENNLTSVNGSKWNDRFKGESTKRPIIRKFYDDKGNICTEELVKHEDNEYYLITCEEKSFNGALQVNRKITQKSDVTYFTEELTTPVLQIKSDSITDFNQATESQSKVEQNTDLTSASEIQFNTTTDDSRID